MAERVTGKITAARLLDESRLIYDDTTLPFAANAVKQGWRSAFVSGADWMREVIVHVRGEPIAPTSAPFQLLGFFKYGLAGASTLLYLALVIWLKAWLLIVGFPFIFYAFEAQMVFLFPLAIDGTPDVLRTCRRWTVRAGGTIRVMLIVMQLAVVMLFGGFAGKGFVRSWSLGCIAVVLWYEELRRGGS